MNTTILIDLSIIFFWWYLQEKDKTLYGKVDYASAVVLKTRNMGSSKYTPKLFHVNYGWHKEKENLEADLARISTICMYFPQNRTHLFDLYETFYIHKIKSFCKINWVKYKIKMIQEGIWKYLFLVFCYFLVRILLDRWLKFFSRKAIISIRRTVFHTVQWILLSRK